jgi:hypothetical protein
VLAARQPLLGLHQHLHLTDSQAEDSVAQVAPCLAARVKLVGKEFSDNQGRQLQRGGGTSS